MSAPTPAVLFCGQCRRLLILPARGYLFFSRGDNQYYARRTDTAQYQQ